MFIVLWFSQLTEGYKDRILTTWPAYVVIDAFNIGNVSNVSEFISPQYFNRESQVDPIRGQLRGPAEFTDIVENLKQLAEESPQQVAEEVSTFFKN